MYITDAAAALDAVDSAYMDDVETVLRSRSGLGSAARAALEDIRAETRAAATGKEDADPLPWYLRAEPFYVRPTEAPKKTKKARK